MFARTPIRYLNSAWILNVYHIGVDVNIMDFKFALLEHFGIVLMVKIIYT